MAAAAAAAAAARAPDGGTFTPGGADPYEFDPKLDRPVQIISIANPEDADDRAAVRATPGGEDTGGAATGGDGGAAASEPGSGGGDDGVDAAAASAGAGSDRASDARSTDSSAAPQVIRLDETALESVMQAVRDTGCSKIAVVSVVGDFRSGKSFLLDCFLRYLRYDSARQTAQETGADADADPPASAPSPEQAVREWLGARGRLAIDGRAGDSHEDRGFMWRPGKARTTTGIWFYGRPFVRTITGGERIAVILMDTQGMFDMQSSNDLTSAIFGLSTLISSHQIYNLKNQIQEDKVEQLHYFTSFSLMAMKVFQKANARRQSTLKRQADEHAAAGDPGQAQFRAAAEDSESAPTPHPFQTIEFLVRDWAHFEDESDVEACEAEMAKVLYDSMRSRFDDGQQARDAIREAFDSVRAYMLPHPGVPMTKITYDGDLGVIDGGFLGLLGRYVARLFGEDLQPKTVAGRPVDATSFPAFIKAYIKVFRSGDLPESVTLVEAMTRTSNLLARDFALAKYRFEMDRVAGPTTDGLSEAELEAHHSAAFGGALELFDSSATFGDDDDIEKTRRDLRAMLTREIQSYRMANEKKMSNAMRRYVWVALVFAFTFVLDRLSDYLCDWWSQWCRDLSQTLALAYAVCFLFLAYASYKLYRAQGWVSLTQSWVGVVDEGWKKTSEAVPAAKKFARQVRRQVSGLHGGGAGRSARDSSKPHDD